MHLHGVKCCEVVRKRERIGEGRGKNWSNSYFFIKYYVEIRVCKNFFLRTLCISNGPVNTALTEKSELTGEFIGNDKRGGETALNKTKPEVIDKIKSRTEKFPTQESHYHRKTSNRNYLDPKLSVRKMYELFVEHCQEKTTQ
jgi:hypothetical protein